MKSLLQPGHEIFEEKKSKFIAYVVSSDLLKVTIDKLKEDHPKARHYVYAVRFLNEFDQIIENFSDDGEPKGSAGRPILNVLKGNDLINVAIIIVRYFGGIKLGVGGLVRAYTESAKAVISKVSLIDYVPTKQITFSINYGDQGNFLHLVNEYGGKVIDRKFEQTRVDICVDLELSKIDSFCMVVKDRRFEE